MSHVVLACISSQARIVTLEGETCFMVCVRLPLPVQGSKLEALQLSFFPTPPAPTPVDANATNPNSKPYTQSNPVYNPPQAPGSPASVGTPTYQANPPMGSTVIVMAPASESPVMVRPPSSSGTLSLGPGAPPPVKAGGAGSSPPKMAD